MEETPRPFDLPGAAFSGKKRLVNVVGVEFESSFQKVDCDARELQLALGDRVVVQTSRGPLIATARTWSKRQVRETGSIEPILRRATVQDEEQITRNRASEADAYRFAIERIKSRKLAMKLVRAQYMVDGSKVVFYFSAEGRVDFRDLVKDLAHRFRTRIEMHQIGVRDGTRMLGGIGSCGRELCCSTFLESFAPVSIRMAKDQGLTLNPVKVSGMCGRLMCCLVYEQQLYRSMRKRLPRANSSVRTRFGPGKVLDLDVINTRVNVELEDGTRRLFDVKDVITGSEGVDGYVGGGDRPNYEWDDEFGSTPVEEPPKDDSKKRRRRRRGSKKPGGQSGGDEPRQGKGAQPAKKTGGQDQKKRGRRPKKADQSPPKGEKPSPQSASPKSAQPAKDGQAKSGGEQKEGESTRSKRSRRSRRSRKSNDDAKPKGEGRSKGSQGDGAKPQAEPKPKPKPSDD